MRDFISFIKENFRKLSFGWTLTFLSSFGQTFLISLYVTSISSEFAITEGSFGAIYAICTVLASFIMLTVGHTVDHVSVKKVTAFTIICLAISCILMGISYHIAFVFISLVGLRLTGQGMLTHISMTILSKFFDKNRGKALSFSSLGFSSGEIVLPLLLTFFIAWFDWRWVMIGSGILLLLYLIRLYFTDLEHFNKQLSIGRPSSLTLVKDFGSIINDRRFLILMPTSFAISFTVTAVIFYQYVFVAQKGWSPQLYAAFFTGYALTRLIFSLAGGLWVDKFTAKRMFRIYLIPITLGLLAFAFIHSIFGALVFLLMMGITVGMSGTIKSSILAEVYGIEKLGAIRSLFTMFMVVSTALGPLIVGWMIDGGLSIETIMLSLFGFMALCLLNAQRIKGVSTRT
ncbi:MFS transporter [Psychroflexus sediminis]|uniref:Nitrate/nitrite transporter NarK n=1 Tax=Psychroflexus sediminis TaxID=470826 RepID=A0A1G7XNY4_9FLAO|nr:MFS transporter [Psychroflexus sediminis]SDG85939.1 Nitrate/nitrite transporter NarK [Psychroflexus sediminis]